MLLHEVVFVELVARAGFEPTTFAKVYEELSPMSFSQVKNWLREQDLNLRPLPRFIKS